MFARNDGDSLLRASLPDPGIALVSPLKGEVCEQYIRCNKTGCRCRSGAPHGPYYYRVWREDARVRKEYVRSEDVVSVREACNAYRTFSRHLRDLRRQRELTVQHIHGEWRKTQRLFKLSKSERPGQ